MFFEFKNKNEQQQDLITADDQDVYTSRHGIGDNYLQGYALGIGGMWSNLFVRCLCKTTNNGLFFFEDHNNW